MLTKQKGETKHGSWKQFHLENRGCQAEMDTAKSQWGKIIFLMECFYFQLFAFSWDSVANIAHNRTKFKMLRLLVWPLQTLKTSIRNIFSPLVGFDQLNCLECITNLKRILETINVSVQIVLSWMSFSHCVHCGKTMDAMNHLSL